MLESSTGAIEADVLVASVVQDDYAYVLDNFTGTSDNDSLVGTSGNDFISGQAGNDTLRGLAGNDNLDGGPGDDVIDGGADYDHVDYYFAPAGITLNLATGSVAGGYGNDTLISVESVRASNFNDSLTGDANGNSLSGEAGNDTIIAGGGMDGLSGGSGDDFLDGGDDHDNASYSFAPGPVVVSLVTGTATGAAGNDVLVRIESLNGTQFADTLVGNADGNLLGGDAGDDTLLGGDGSDNIIGGPGNDSLDGGLGINDTVNYFDAPGPVIANLGAGTASGAHGNDTLAGFEVVFASQFNDTIIGSDGDDHFRAFQGDDLMQGGAGLDLFDSDPGDDTYDGGAGTQDAIDFHWIAGPVTVNLATGTASSADGSDTLIDIEVVIATDSDDLIVGNAGDNLFWDRLGNDTIHGGAGNDIFKEDGGADSMYGGPGDDEFWIDDPTDVVVELPGEGIDLLIAAFSTTLPDYVERSLYNGPPGGGITGNALDNVITGNSFDNVLDGAERLPRQMLHQLGEHQLADVHARHLCLKRRQIRALQRSNRRHTKNGSLLQSISNLRKPDHALTGQ